MVNRGDRLRAAVLYPDLMNIYADRGNILFLRRRCEWRGIGFELNGVAIGERFAPDAVDLLYIGGGQDRDQELCAEDMAMHQQSSLRQCAADGKPILAVCGGYQLLGRSYQTDHGTLPGAALAPLSTASSTAGRLVGPTAIRTDLGGPTEGIVAGFENHAGRTTLDDPANAFGRVLAGHGNNGRDGTEGYRSGSVIGTYLHGPLLPKNWWLADWLIASALGRSSDELTPLDDTLERAAHREALSAAGLP